MTETAIPERDEPGSLVAAMRQRGAISEPLWRDLHADTKAAEQAVREAAFMQCLLAAVVGAQDGGLVVAHEAIGRAALRRLQIRDVDGGISIRLAPDSGSEGRG